MSKMIFLTGATGYMGRRLSAELLRRGRAVTALVRKGSESKAPPRRSVALSYGDLLELHDALQRMKGVPVLLPLAKITITPVKQH